MKLCHFCSWMLMLLLPAMLSACSTTPVATTSTKDALHDRVMQSGKIRCGYFIFPPYCMKDPNTGKMSGIFVEALTEAAKNLNLSLEWTEEVGYGTMIEGLKNNRYDIVPTGVWPNANRARYADFSIPLFYSGVGVYARSSDNRFSSKNIRAIDSDQITISTIDGTVQDLMAKKNFPHARILSHPDSSEASQILLDVVHKKADVTFIEPGLVGLFLKNNPGTLKSITGRKPIGVVGNTMMFKIGEPSFKSMLNTALAELIQTGYINRLLDKYEPIQGAYYRVSSPYDTQDTSPDGKN